MFDFWGNRSRPKLMICSLLLAFETLPRLSEHSNLSFQTCRHLKMWSIKNVSTRTKRGRRTLCSSLRRTRKMLSFASFQRCVSFYHLLNLISVFFTIHLMSPISLASWWEGFQMKKDLYNVAKFPRQMKPFSLMDVYNQPPSSPLTLKTVYRNKVLQAKY